MANHNPGLDRRFFGFVSLVLASVCVLFNAAPALAEKSVPADQLDQQFTLEVLPVLKSKCFACHGDDTQEVKGELDLTSRAGHLKGGESGDPSIVPGKPDESLLMEAVLWEGLEMPPKENDRLNKKQIEALRRWIEAGAAWPNKETQQRYRDEARTAKETSDGVLVTTSGGLSDEWTYRRYKKEDLWAWQPVRSKDETLGEHKLKQNVVDHFVGKKLEKAGFNPAPTASPRALIRRATFDLIGLPPSPEEIESFLSAWDRDAEAAWRDLIDRLLESPHYGEHWAKHWLDVTRYADTGGMSNDYERSNMWRYRDYVVRAFNEDKPYDQFVIEQLAGDELADESVRKRVGDDEAKIIKTQLNGDYNEEEAEWIVATGFLRLGPWDNAMVEKPEARQIYVDDVVNAVGQTFLSTTMRCVKCHDHKFDPIPTRDYYRMYAAFSTTHMAERKVPHVSPENRIGFNSGKEHVQKMLDFAVEEKNKLENKRETAAKAWYREHGLEYKNLNDRKNLPDEEKPPRHVGLDYVDEGQLKIRQQDEWIWRRRLERYEPMAQSVYNANDPALAGNGARKLRIDRKAKRDEPPVTNIFLGGALTALGEAVGPGVLSAVALATNEPQRDRFLLSDDVSGRRLGLARWIANKENALATRSIVNRIWQYHFGQGIARNPNNFGGKGAKPTHPMLLDYLTADFVENGWTFKRLHRTLMLSKTYQQATQHPKADELAQIDPNNELWAFMPQRRLTAEELRDAMLIATGELNPEIGGLPVMPEINMEVALAPRMIQFSLAPAYQPSRTPTERNRRTIYAYRVRGQADPFLELFNQPNPNESCEHRDTAAVTPQVFSLLNSDMMTDRSIAMAIALQDKSDTLAEWLEIAYQRALGRNPTEQELQRLSDYFTDMVDYHSKTEATPVTYPTAITRSNVEEFSGKPFEYQEILPIFENYQPDPKPADVSAETRALADVCLLLFNTNEFMFVQ